MKMGLTEAGSGLWAHGMPGFCVGVHGCRDPRPTSQRALWAMRRGLDLAESPWRAIKYRSCVSVKFCSVQAPPASFKSLSLKSSSSRVSHRYINLIRWTFEKIPLAALQKMVFRVLIESKKTS